MRMIRNRVVPVEIQKMKTSKLIALIFSCHLGFAPALSMGAEWQIQTINSDAAFRGLCVVDQNVVWAGGTKGTFVRTTDAGKNWHAGQVAGAGSLDFRDVEALDGETAWLLSIGEGSDSRIYKTTDGGNRWTLQFQNERPEAFFDALAFWDDQHGIALSDPVDGCFLLVATTNGGALWEPVRAKMPPAVSGESAFAASGTCLVAQGQSNVWFATGGAGKGRVFRSVNRGQTWTVSETPVPAATNSAGIFSLAFRDERHGVAVGGNHEKHSETRHNFVMTEDGGASWQESSTNKPRGFRSGVAWLGRLKRSALVAVGPSGFGLSKLQWPVAKAGRCELQRHQCGSFQSTSGVGCRPERPHRPVDPCPGRPLG
jgi:photosystem II stability/assembly factor-like uncharacterized protein